MRTLGCFVPDHSVAVQPGRLHPLMLAASRAARSTVAR